MSIIDAFLSNQCAPEKQDRQSAINRLVKGMIDRYGYQHFSRKLREQNLETGDSYLGTVDIVTKQLIRKENWGVLEYFAHEYMDNLLFGENYLKFHRVEQELMNAMVTAFCDYKLPDSSFNDAYPLPLTDAEIALLPKETLNVPTPIHYEEMAGLHLMVLASVRYFHAQERFNADSLSPVQLKEFENLLNKRSDYVYNFAEVIFKRQQLKQFFDVIILEPACNLIHVLIDAPSTQVQDQTKKQVDQAFANLTSWLRKMTTTFDLPYTIPPHLNLHYVIEPLCRDVGEGLLKMYACVTDESLALQPKARTLARDKNLRTDKMLEEMEAAASTHGITTEVYQASIAWPQEDRAIQLISDNELYIPHLELHLLGRKPRTRGRGDRGLDHAIIRGVENIDDYKFLCEKIFKYLR